MMVGELQPLWQAGPFTLTAYSLMMGLAALLGIGCTLYTAGKKGEKDRAVPLACLSVLAAMAGGHFAYCCAMFPALESDFGGFGFFFRLNEGGYTLFGAVFFVLLLCAVLGRAWSVRPGKLMDILSPGAALALCAGRLAEAFNGQGIGAYVENEALRFFPLAVCTYADEDWSEWNLAVFAFEALAALVIFAAVVFALKKGLREGYAAGLFLTLLSASQIFLEQLRTDELIRFGFVRFSQLCALAVLIPLFIMRLRRARWGRTETAVHAMRFVSAALCIVFVEFAFEKPQFYPYLMASVACLGLSLAFLPLRAAITRRAEGGKRAVLVLSGLVPCVLAVLFINVLTLGLENEWDYLYILMAAACILMGAESCPRREEKVCTA